MPACDAKPNDHCPLPRLSISSRTTMVSSMDNSSPSLQTVMKWKTVLAIFVVVVAYLVIGGLVFRALEQPFESNQKNTIALEKSEFLQKHPCVKSGELEALIQVKCEKNIIVLCRCITFMKLKQTTALKAMAISLYLFYDFVIYCFYSNTVFFCRSVLSCFHLSTGAALQF